MIFHSRFFLGFLTMTLVACSSHEAAEIYIVKQPPDALISVGRSIEQDIHEDPELRNYEVNITVSDKGATLRGEVATQEERKRVEEIAQRHIKKGRVINAVTLASDLTATDEQISYEVRKALETNGVRNVEEISIRTENGIVYLSGNRLDRKEIEEIRTITLKVPLVTEVKSEFTISPPVILAGQDPPAPRQE
jgi:osmotically-inducible protein OsmY